MSCIVRYRRLAPVARETLPSLYKESPVRKGAFQGNGSPCSELLGCILDGQKGVSSCASEHCLFFLVAEPSLLAQFPDQPLTDQVTVSTTGAHQQSDMGTGYSGSATSATVRIGFPSIISSGNNLRFVVCHKTFNCNEKIAGTVIDAVPTPKFVLLGVPVCLGNKPRKKT